MSTNLLRNIAHKTATDTLRDLTKAGVDLPPDVTAAEKNLRALTARKPAPVTPADLAAAYQNGTPDDELEALAARVVTHDARTAAWAEAVARAGEKVLRRITGNGDHITRQLADLADPLIADLTKLAALPSLDLAALLAAGRHADATLAGQAEHIAASLSHLYALRGKVTKGAAYGVGGWDCSAWRRPDIVRRLTEGGVLRADMTPATRYLTGIRHDAGLWFPLPAEAEAAARPIATEAAERAEKSKARDWGIGSVVA